MNEEIIKYAKGMNAKQKIIDWINKELYKLNVVNQTEIEHIIDYLVSDKAPKKLDKATYKQMLDNTNKWNKTLIKKGSEIKELKKDIKIIVDFKDGFKFVKLIGKNAYEREGFLMRHCVSQYYNKEDEIYSLRDKNNNPHCTISKQSQQIKGKGNGSISPKYIKYVVDFLKHLKIDVKDNEMVNLGYYNIEKFKKHLHKDSIKQLFNKKYWFKENKLLNKTKEIFYCLDMLDFIPLINNNLKLNFDITTFVSVSIKFLFNSIKKKTTGDSSQLATTGNYSKLATSGDSSHLATSGNYSKLATTGNYSKLATSGNSSHLATSGDYSQLATTGHSSKLATTGDYSQLATSGNSSQLAVKGKYSVASNIGFNGTIKGILGTWITLAEYDNRCNVICVKSAQIDGKKLKENVWYKLKNKKFVEVERQ